MAFIVAFETGDEPAGVIVAVFLVLTAIVYTVQHVGTPCCTGQVEEQCNAECACFQGLPYVQYDDPPPPYDFACAQPVYLHVPSSDTAPPIYAQATIDLEILWNDYSIVPWAKRIFSDATNTEINLNCSLLLSY